MTIDAIIEEIDRMMKIWCDSAAADIQEKYYYGVHPDAERVYALQQLKNFIVRRDRI